MIKINNFFKNLLIFLFVFFSVNAEEKTLNIGNNEAKIVVKVFSSLTCPHCANFHQNIFDNLKKEYIDKKIVKFEHHAFPLDLAALNAEIIVRCQSDKSKSFQMLGEIYKKQKQWAVGSDIIPINDSIKKIASKFGLDNKTMNQCLDNEEAQDRILNERIVAQKKYKIQSTPTISINEKKYGGKHEYKYFKKALEKFL